MSSSALHALIVLEAVVVAWLLLALAVDAVRAAHRRRRQPLVAAARTVLLEAVVSGDAGTATGALRALPNAECDDVLCDVATTVESGRDPLFEEVAAAVGTIARAERQLSSRGWWVRQAALRRLTAVGYRSPVGEGLLHDRSPHVRAAAVEWVGVTTPAEEASRHLVDMLGDDAEQVRSATKTVLCSLGTAANPILRTILIAGDGRDLRSAIEVIRALGDPTLLVDVRPFLHHSDEIVRREAILTSGPVLTESDVPMLSRMLAADDVELRCVAVEAAGQAGLRSLVSPIAQAMEDPDGGVREAAIAALDRLGPRGELLLARASAVGS